MMEYISTGTALVLGAGLCFGAGTLVSRYRAGPLNSVNFEGFVQNINEGYYRSSLEGKQLFGNKALIRLNGYESEEEFLNAVGDIATEWYVDPGRREQFKLLLEENGYVENFVSEIYRHKTRERIWISENARLVCDSEGRPEYYEGTIREHTETMKRLHMQELHARLAEQVPGVLFQAKQVQGEVFKIPYFSSGFEEMLGLKPGQIEQDASVVTKIIHRDDIDGFTLAAQRAANDLKPLNHQFRIHPEDGIEVWIEVNAKPLQEEKGVILWHGIMLDVTSKKSDEAKIRNLAFVGPRLSDLDHSMDWCNSHNAEKEVA